MIEHDTGVDKSDDDIFPRQPLGTAKSVVVVKQLEKLCAEVRRQRPNLVLPDF